MTENNVDAAIVDDLWDEACSVLWHDGDPDSAEWRRSREILCGRFHAVLRMYRRRRERAASGEQDKS